MLAGHTETLKVSSITLDCSVAVPWVLAEQSNCAIDALFQDGYRGAVDLLVPVLWFTECGSVLNEMVKRGRLSLAQAQEGLSTLRCARMKPDAAPHTDTQSHVLALACAHGLSFYDATYLELALRRRSVLATLDPKLKAAANHAGVLCLSL